MSDSLQKILCASLEAGPNAVALFDLQDRLCFANNTFVELYEVDRPEDTHFIEIMRNCHLRKRGLLIESENLDTWLAGVVERRRKVSSRAYQADFLDGRWFWVTETLLDDGWLYYSGTDITALKYNESAILRARDAALLAANTDALTGLGNRRVMLESLQHALTGFGAACMLDLDYFKNINDRYGHPVGDRVLRHFADSASSQLRPGDRLTRIGGEEFFLMLPFASLLQADSILQRLRQYLRRDAMFTDVPGLRYTFSAGVTAFETGDTIDNILRHADEALYQAKQSGRDQQVIGKPSNTAV